MPARRKKPIRITAARVELYLDKLAEIMDEAGPDAHLGVPLWKRLGRELDRLRVEIMEHELCEIVQAEVEREMAR